VMASAPELQPDAPAGAAAAFFRAIARDPAAALVGEGGGPSDVELVCGFLGCDLHPSNPLLEGLPRVVHLRRPRLDAAADPLQLLVEFAVAESKDHQAGTLCVLLRLSEVLFVEVIRRYLHGLPEAERTWLSALRDPAVGRALALLHERPGAAWTLEQLARDLGVSRSVLADRFTLFVGQPPMRYLARWRMQLASHRLSDQTAKVAAIALELGYKSEAAFSRAFKRIVGTSPAAWRRQRAQTPAAPALTD
jgi:AraC-like DNA-binding protein